MEIKKESNDYIIKFNNHEVLVFLNGLFKFVENNEIIDEAEQKNIIWLRMLIRIHIRRAFYGEL